MTHIHTPSISRSRDGDALIQACQQEGCPVCLVTLERLERAMDLWQYEGASDAANHERLIRARGFCPRHTWQLTRLVSLPTTFPLALVYRDTLPELLAEIQRQQEQIKARSRPGYRRVWDRLRRRRREQSPFPCTEPSFLHCLFCQQQAQIEQQLVNELLVLLSHAELYTQLGLATGFCRSHVAQALRSAESDTQRTALLACQATCLQRNLEELKELVRKHDYRFRQEPQGEEMTAWRRAASLFVGNPGTR